MHWIWRHYGRRRSRSGLRGKGRELLGCGALKELDPQHGEIKSMRTGAAHLRKGVAAHLLTYVLEKPVGVRIPG